MRKILKKKIPYLYQANRAIMELIHQYKMEYNQML